MENELIVVRQLPIIEEQLQSVSNAIDNRVKLALSMACTEDTYKSVKEVRSQLNKEFAGLEAQRKEIKAQILAPYQAFEAVYKRLCADKYTEADAILKSRIGEVEAGLKHEKAVEVTAYFDEYRQSLGIPEDMVSFDRTGISITMSVSKKALKNAVKSYLDGIAGDLAIIETQERKDEVLVEYRRHLNLSKAITDVDQRHKAMEAEQRRREAETAEREARDEAKSRVEEIMEETKTLPAADVQPVSAPQVMAPPAEEQPETPVKLFSTAFRVTGSLEQLKALKNFLEDGGYRYEQL